MNLEFLNDYLVLIVVGICLCVGYVIKKRITKIPDKYIPLIIAVLGVILNIWLNSFSFTPEILLGGMFSGLASTGLHQLFKQLVDEETAE